MTTKVRLNQHNIEFVAKPDQTVLDAALENGVNLQYGCSNGRCGDCKAELIEGEVSVKDNLFDGELAEGEILTCCTVPENDLVINAYYIPELDHIERQTAPAKVDTFTLLNDDVMQIVLRIPPRVKFDYLPGQYLDLLWNGEKRSYSIAQAKVQESRIELHIKKVEDGVFSRFFFNEMKTEQLFRIHGPLGTFFLKDGNSPLIFLCTGTGFAPIKALLEDVIEKNISREIFIYWGARYRQDLYSSLPQNLADKVENIHFYPVLSREAEEADTFFNGYVQDAVLQNNKDISMF